MAAPAGAAAAAASSGPVPPPPPQSAPAAPRFSLADCTADLLAIIVGGLDARERAAFATACSFHLLVLRMVAERGEWVVQGQHGKQQLHTGSPASEAAAASAVNPPPFGLGYVDRPRFLQPGERRETVALVSYPRSGNSMLRGLLERVTGVVTGSDTRPDRVLSRSLLKKGLRGEGVVDNRAWVVKTHWPERYGYRRFPAHRVILLVRNPFDAINSYFNMGLTNTHEQTLTDEVYESLGGLWDEMLKSEVKVWARFNAHWLNRGLPLLAVRYEDLLLHPEEMLVRLVAFLEQLPTDAVRASPVYMGRVRAAAAAVGGKGRGSNNKHPSPPAPAAAAAADGSGEPPAGPAKEDGDGAPVAAGGRVSDPLHANRPRSGGGIGRSMRYYSPAQVQAVCELGGSGLRAFGYDPLTQNFPHAMLSLPPYERCVKFLDNAQPTLPPAGAAAPAASAPAPAPPVAVTVNLGMSHYRQLRPPDDKFGRGITKTRHALTDEDRRPLPTVQK